MQPLSNALHEIDSCRNIQSGWKHLRTRLQEERTRPLRRCLQSLRKARPNPSLQELEQARRSLRRLPLKLRPRLWLYRTGNAALNLLARILRRRFA